MNLAKLYSAGLTDKEVASQSLLKSGLMNQIYIKHLITGGEKCRNPFLNQVL